MLYTIIDVESTGFSREFADILSFGFLRINSQFEIKESGNLYFYLPNFKVENKDAFEVHGLTRDFLSQYEKDFAVNITKMYSLMYHSCLIGKNIDAFDIPLINSFFKRYAKYLPKFEYTSSVDLQKRFKDTYQARTGSRKVGTLTDYCNVLGITKDTLNNIYDSLPTKDENPNAKHMHSSLYDCIAIYCVFKEFCKIRGIQP